MQRVDSPLYRALTFFFILIVFAVCITTFGAAAPPPQGVPATQSVIQRAPLARQNDTIPKVPGAPVSDGQIMNVRAPAGQVMYVGTTVRIEWDWPNYVNFPADVTLWQGARRETSVKVATIDSQRYALWTSWSIPYTFAPGNYAIRVCSSKNPANCAELLILIKNGTITVTSPNSNFAMATGSAYSIWWQYQGRPGNVKIELTNTSGTTPLLIAASVPGGEMGLGKFDWVVPSTLAIASGYLVKVTSLASSTITGTSQPFSIAPPSITITSPKRGEEWLPAVYIPITWRSLGNSFGDTVHITAWAVGSSGTSLDATCPLKQGTYGQWMPMSLDKKMSYTIRIESTQNRSIYSEVGPVTVLPRQSQPPNTGSGAASKGAGN